MNMRREHLELEALDAGLRESGGFAVRVLYSAAAACAGRDAGRANVVLGFEADARRDHGRAEAVSVVTSRRATAAMPRKSRFMVHLEFGRNLAGGPYPDGPVGLRRANE